MFLPMFFKMQNNGQTMHLTMLIAHPYPRMEWGPRPEYMSHICTYSPISFLPSDSKSDTDGKPGLRDMFPENRAPANWASGLYIYLNWIFTANTATVGEYMSVEFIYCYWLYSVNNWGIYVNYKVSGECAFSRIYIFQFQTSSN